MEQHQIPQPPGQGPSVNPFAHYEPPIEDRRAEFGIRFGALVIDGVIAALFAGLLTLLISPLNLPTPEIVLDVQDSMDELFKTIDASSELERTISQLIIGSSYASAIAAVLYMLIEGLTGASIGKRILKLTVARADGTRGTQSLFLSRMIVKNSDRILHLLAVLPLLTFLSGPIESASSIIGFVLFIGCFAALGRNRMALHDMVVKTAVFKTSDVRYE